jgi:hypothetical protein
MKRYTFQAAIREAKIFNQLRLEYPQTNKNRRKDSSSSPALPLLGWHVILGSDPHESHFICTLPVIHRAHRAQEAGNVADYQHVNNRRPRTWSNASAVNATFVLVHTHLPYLPFCDQILFDH